MGWFSSTTRAVGLDIGTRCIKAVELEKSGAIPILKGFASEGLKPGLLEDGRIKQPEDLARIVESFLTVNGFSRDKVVVSVDAAAATMQIEEFPVRKEAELDQAIRFWMKENLVGNRVPFSHYALERTVDEAGGNIYRVLFVWSDSEVVKPYEALIERLKFKQSIIDVDMIAAVNGIDMTGEYNPVLLLEAGTDTANLAVLESGTLKHTITLNTGSSRSLKENPDLANHQLSSLEEDLKIKGFDAQDDVGHEFRDSGVIFFRRVKTALEDFQKRHRAMKLTKVICAGGYSLIPGFTRFTTEQLGLPAEIATLQPVKGQEFPESTRGLYATALGLAIRGLS